MRSKLVLVISVIAIIALGVVHVMAQDAAAPAPAAAGGDAGTVQLAEGQSDAAPASGTGFITVVLSSGWLGVLLWLALLAVSLWAGALVVDDYINVRPKKIMPEKLVTDVRGAMEQGDVMKALKICEDNPCPLANILSAGFSNVQEGFETIQDIVGVVADEESEKLIQRIAYLNLCGNLAPMLGLLGTVQGMIFAFASLATMSAGAAQQSALAMNIAQALYTTAAGLIVAIPAVGFFQYFKNRATNMVLSMELLTMDLIKVLRNVEVVQE